MLATEKFGDYVIEMQENKMSICLGEDRRSFMQQIEFEMSLEKQVFQRMKM